VTQFLWWWEVPSLPVIVTAMPTGVAGSQVRVAGSGANPTLAQVLSSTEAVSGVDGALAVTGQAQVAVPGAQNALLAERGATNFRGDDGGRLIVMPYGQRQLWTSGFLDDVAIAAAGVAPWNLTAPASNETIFITSVCLSCLAQSTVKLESPSGTPRGTMRLSTATLKWEHTFPVPLVGTQGQNWFLRSASATTFNGILIGFILRTAA